MLRYAIAEESDALSAGRGDVRATTSNKKLTFVQHIRRDARVIPIDSCPRQPQEFAATHTRCLGPRCAVPASTTPLAPAPQATRRHRRVSDMVTLVCHSPILGRIGARTGALAR